MGFCRHEAADRLPFVPSWGSTGARLGTRIPIFQTVSPRKPADKGKKEQAQLKPYETA